MNKEDLKRSVYPQFQHKRNSLALIVLFVGITSGLIGYELKPKLKANRVGNPAALLQPTRTPSISPPLNVQSSASYPTMEIELPAANWQFYKDPSTDFSFRYPPHWKHQSPLTISLNPDPTKDPIFINYQIQYLPEGTTSDKYFTNFYPKTPNDMKYSSRLTVNGYPAIKTTYMPELSYEIFTIVAPAHFRKEGSLETGRTLAAYTFIFSNVGQGENHPYPVSGLVIKTEIENFHKMVSSLVFPK